MRRFMPSICLFVTLCCVPCQAELRVPGATAYLDPDADGARVSAEQGVTRWTDPRVTVTWFGELKQAGKLRAALVVRVPVRTTSRLRLTIAGQSAGDIEALVLDGAASEGAHFNLQPRRNAASVHLAYPVPQDVDVSAFYCEMTGVEEPLWTYYMACGWHRGYFGMQVNSETERRIIFSVWDSGGEAVDRNKVATEDRVTLVEKGDGVDSGSFGNEGTGGHSHLTFPWKTGQRQRFLVTAAPVDDTHTVFASYYYRPDKAEWMLISSWQAPKEGKYLRGLYSFSENFAGRNGHMLRKARYGNQWIRTAAGEWIELTAATFSHDSTGKEDRLDRFMGVEDGEFFLSHGGFVAGYTKFGTPFTRSPSGRSPATMNLPNSRKD